MGTSYRMDSQGPQSSMLVGEDDSVCPGQNIVVGMSGLGDFSLGKNL